MSLPLSQPSHEPQQLLVVREADGSVDVHSNVTHHFHERSLEGREEEASGEEVLERVQRETKNVLFARPKVAVL